MQKKGHMQGNVAGSDGSVCVLTTFKDPQVVDEQELVSEHKQVS